MVTEECTEEMQELEWRARVALDGDEMVVRSLGQLEIEE